MEILSTKIHLPPARRSLARPRLFARIDAGINRGCRLTLVAAPAGFGKTSLLAGWLAHSNLSVAWLSLDPEDNDLTRFLSYLLESLHQAQPDMAAGLSAALPGSAPPPIEALLTSVLNQLAERDARLVLVLEDYHVIERPEIDQALLFLVEHAPAQLHIVVTSRHDPLLPLARLRANGLLHEIRADDLRFTPAEAADFLAAAGVELGAEQVQTLAERSEGWIAGLQLAALSLRERSDSEQFLAGFSGSSRYVMDYLTDEVLSRQPQAVQDFLLQTAPLERMCAGLCDAVLGLSGSSQAMLEWLERANLFIVPLDDERRWYRYHHLFADLLRHRLQQSRPTLLPQIQRRAALWHIEQGDLSAAVQHALASGDADIIERILLQAGETALQRNRPSLALRWFAAIPAPLLAERPLLALFKGWVLSYFDQAADWVAGLPAELPPGSSNFERGLHTALQGQIAWEQGHFPAAIEQFRAALDILGSNAALIRSRLLMLLGRGLLMTGADLEQALAAIQEARRIATASGNDLTTTEAFTTTTSILTAQGRDHEALALLQPFTGNPPDDPQSLPPAAGWPFVIEGTIRHLRNELDIALQKIDYGLSVGASLGPAWPANLSGHAARATVLMSLDRRTEALELIDWLRAAIVNLPAMYRMTIDAVAADLHLRAGDRAYAETWAAQTSLAPGYHFDLGEDKIALPYLRLLIAQDRFSDARRVIAGLDELANRLHLAYRQTSLRVLEAIIALRENDEQQALEHLRRAVQIAAPRGYLRLILDEDPQIARLLPQVRDAAPDFIDRLLAAYGATANPPQELVEPLTAREIEVLRLLAAGKSNREIADELVLAVGTVKRHVINIFGKLGVSNRTAAAARARELGFL